MAVYLTEVVTDLAMPPQQRPIPHQFAMGDNNAYTITALLCDSRNPEAELLDGTVGGELVRPDGVTVALEGEKGDAVRQVNLAAGGLCNATPCSVTLPQACFAVPGRVTLTIKLTDGTTITQALSVSAVVVRTSTDEAVDPGEVIPDRGCAIFLHCSKGPTGGCVGLPESSMIRLLQWLDPSAHPQILITETS